MAKRGCFFISSQGSGRVSDEISTRAQAVRELRDIVADAAKRCRQSYKRCSVVRLSPTSINIKVGGRDRGTPLYNHYAVVSCR